MLPRQTKGCLLRQEDRPTKGSLLLEKDRQAKEFLLLREEIQGYRLLVQQAVESAVFVLWTIVRRGSESDGRSHHQVLPGVSRKAASL